MNKDKVLQESAITQCICYFNNFADSLVTCKNNDQAMKLVRKLLLNINQLNKETNYKLITFTNREFSFCIVNLLEEYDYRLDFPIDEVINLGEDRVFRPLKYKENLMCKQLNETQKKDIQRIDSSDSILLKVIKKTQKRIE